MRYGSLSVRTECNHCGAPVPLDAPVLEVSCAQCTEQVSMPASLWGEMLHELDEEIDELANGEGHRLDKVIGGQKVVYEIKRELPHCEKCNAPLPVAEFPVGTSQNIACTQCGDPASTEPTPSWLAQVAPNAKQLYRVEPDPELAGSGGIALTPAAVPRPAALACPSCGAGLQITVDHPRLTPCRFCGADVYLPDAVWRKLHPVKVVTPFYVRFEGLTRRARQQLLAAQRAAREAEQAAEQARELQLLGAEQAREAEQRHEGIERQIAATRSVAWTLSLLTGVSTAALVGVRSLPRFGFDTGTGIYALVVIVFAALTVLLAAGAVFSGSRMIQLRCQVDFGYMFFVTWFWLPWSAIPFAGAAVAAGVAFVLYRGKFAEAYITGEPYHPAMDIGNVGHPAAFVFIVIALANLLLYWPMFI